MKLISDLILENDNQVVIIPSGSIIIESVTGTQLEIEVPSTNIDLVRRHVGYYEEKPIVFPDSINSKRLNSISDYIRSLQNNSQTIKMVVSTINLGRKGIVDAEEGSHNAYSLISVGDKHVDRTKTSRFKTGSSGTDWLDSAMDSINKFVDRGDIKRVDVSLPDIMTGGGSDIPYIALTASGGGDLVMLMSPRKGEGLYIVKTIINIDGTNMPWQQAINSFTSSDQERKLLSFRDYIRETGQGTFFRRDKWEMDDILTGLAFDDLSFLSQLHESLIKMFQMLRG